MSHWLDWFNGRSGSLSGAGCRWSENSLAVTTEYSVYHNAPRFFDLKELVERVVPLSGANLYATSAKIEI